MNKAINSTHRWLVLFGLYETALTVGGPLPSFSPCDIEECVGVYRTLRPALYYLAFRK